MKKLFIGLLIVGLTIVVGIISYGIKKDSIIKQKTLSTQINTNNFNNSITESGNIAVNQNTNLQNTNTNSINNSSSNISTSSTSGTNSNNQSSVATNSYNKLFGYNSGFNIFYNQNIDSSYDKYKSALNNKFEELYGNYKDVIIRVPYIFTTVRNGQVDAVAEYNISMTKESNGNPLYYTSPIEAIWIPVSYDSSLKNTATLPQQAKTLDSNMGKINPINSFEYLNSQVYLNQTQESYDLYSDVNPNSQVISTVNSNESVFQITNLGKYNLVYANGVLAWIKASAINRNSPFAPSKAINYHVDSKLSNSVGYNLTLKGANQEGSNMDLLKSAMNYEFNGTGYTVVATNLQGYEGMMHEGCYYNITYTSPDGKTVTLKNQSINGLTNPDNGAFAFWFNNEVTSPFNF